MALKGRLLFAGTEGAQWGDAGEGVFVSSGGVMWTKRDGSNGNMANRSVYAIAVLDSTVYVGVDRCVYRTTNDGVDWLPGCGGLNSPSTQPFPIHALIARPGNIFAAAGGGVYVSTDDGSNWILRDSGLPSSVHCFQGWRATVFAGTDSGVYASTDHGISWSAFGSSLPGAAQGVHALAVDSFFVYSSERVDSTYHIMAGTDSGVWFDLLYTNVTEDVGSSAGFSPVSLTLEPAYPNPSAGLVDIGFVLSHSVPVTLKIFNALGREVATLADGVHARGNHVVSFDPTGLSAGVYWCRLAAGGSIESEQVIVVH